VRGLLRNDLLSDEDLDHCTKFALDNALLFRIAAKNLAVRIWEDTIPDPDEFQAYLNGNSVFNKQVMDVIHLREAEGQVSQEKLVRSRKQAESVARDLEYWEA
jgi:hypothetical protein